MVERLGGVGAARELLGGRERVVGGREAASAPRAGDAAVLRRGYGRCLALRYAQEASIRLVAPRVA